MANFTKVLVGFSGGPDSRFLVDFLIKNKEKFGIKKIACAHLNHQLRGDEADRDEKFCKNTCEQLGLKLFAKRLDIAKIAKESSKGLEETARDERYKFFAEIYQNENFDVVAIAHNSTDNLETVIFKLARGAKNPTAGIRPLSERVVNGRRIKIWRPILNFSKNEILSFLQKNKIDFVIDSTNFDENYSRNKIRHKILPLLREINPSVEKNVLRNGAHQIYSEKLSNEKSLWLLRLLSSNKEINLGSEYNLHIFSKFSKQLQSSLIHKLISKLSENQFIKIRISTSLIKEIVKFLSSNGTFMQIGKLSDRQSDIDLHLVKTLTKFSVQESVK